MATEEQRLAMKNYILADPTLGPMASGPGTDYAAIVAAVNAPVTPVVRTASAASVLRWAARHDSIQKLKLATADPATRPMADAALSLISSPHISVLHLDDAEIAGMFAALVTAGVFSQSEADDLNDLSKVNISKAEELYGNNISISDVGGILV